MRYKTLIFIVAMLSLSIELFFGVAAVSANNVSLHGSYVTIELTFPEEAHSAETITHNLTIIASKWVKLFNFTIIINALVNATWQQVYQEYISESWLPAGQSIKKEMLFALPQNTNERLYCSVYLLTADSLDDLTTYSFYTTYVRTLTYDELLGNYNNLSRNYSNLLSEYQKLLQSSGTVSERYTNLNVTYNLLLSQYNTLGASYSSLNSTYLSLQGNYRSLNQTFTTLQAEVSTSTTELNNTRNVMYFLITATAILSALTIYIKKKKPSVVFITQTVPPKPRQPNETVWRSAR